MNLTLNTTSLRVLAEPEGYEQTQQDRDDLQEEYRQLCRFWALLSPAQVQQLVAEKTAETQIESNNNLRALGGFYEGEISVRAVYVHKLTRKPIMPAADTYAPASDWKVVRIKGGAVKETLEFGLSKAPAALMALVEVNGGVPPVILPPDPEPENPEMSENPETPNP